MLAGPEPRALIDPVPSSASKGEVRKTLRLSLGSGLEPMHAVAWRAFWVGLLCRILHALHTGEVTSKKAAPSWAQDVLAPRWRGLIQRAQALRKGHASTDEPADP